MFEREFQPLFVVVVVVVVIVIVGHVVVVVVDVGVLVVVGDPRELVDHGADPVRITDGGLGLQTTTTTTKSLSIIAIIAAANNWITAMIRIIATSHC